MFTLLLNLNMKRCPEAIRRLLRNISNISLGLYLISWIFDRLIYDGCLIPGVPVIAERWKFFPVTVPCVFLLSSAAASVLYLIQFCLHRLCRLPEFLKHVGK